MKYNEAKLLERGTLVRFNSGGPDMTLVSFRLNEVLHSEDENSECIVTLETRWFNDSDELENAEFSHWEVFVTG